MAAKLSLTTRHAPAVVFIVGEVLPPQPRSGPQFPDSDSFKEVREPSAVILVGVGKDERRQVRLAVALREYVN